MGQGRCIQALWYIHLERCTLWVKETAQVVANDGLHGTSIWGDVHNCGSRTLHSACGWRWSLQYHLGHFSTQLVCLGYKNLMFKCSHSNNILLLHTHLHIDGAHSDGILSLHAHLNTVQMASWFLSGGNSVSQAQNRL